MSENQHTGQMQVPIEQAQVPTEAEGPGVPTVYQASMVSLQEMRVQANIMIESGFLPSGVDTPGKVLAIMLKGRELGLPPMMAVNSLYVVHGGVGTDGKTMLAIAYRSGLLEGIKFEEDDASCKVTITRKGFPPYTSTWSDADSKQAGLSGKDSYRKYPREMRRWRAVTAGLRVVMPDVMGGLYGWEEISGEPPYGTLPTDLGALATEAIEGEIVDAPVADWMTFSTTAKALGYNTKEALYVLNCADFPEAKERYGTPQAALEALRGHRVDKDAEGRRAALLDVIAATYGMTVPVLEQMTGVVTYIDSLIAEDPTLSVETFDFGELVNERGELYGVITIPEETPPEEASSGEIPSEKTQSERTSLSDSPEAEIG